MQWIPIGLLLFITIIQTNAQQLDASATAVEQIHALRTGILLVQLDSKQNEIYVLKKSGKKVLAESLEKDQYLKNKEICYAFNSYFDFCPVFYFYKAYAKELRNGNFDKVVLLNENLEPAYKVDLKDELYLIAEWGHHIPELAKCDVKPTDHKGFRGLFMLNPNFVQLSSPFPFAVKERKFLWFKKDAFTMVEQWNDALHTFLAIEQVTPK